MPGISDAVRERQRARSAANAACAQDLEDPGGEPATPAVLPPDRPQRVRARLHDQPPIRTQEGCALSGDKRQALRNGQEQILVVR